MDTKYNFPIDKDKRPELNGLNNNFPTEDESLLRQPLRTSSAGFREAKRAYENGTDEVRRLLMQECSLIYECNVCRNMFRSLANFISHKRIYCKQLTEGNSYHSYSGLNSSVLIQTIERPEPWLNKSRSTGSSPVPTTKSSNRDLSKVIERLKRVDVTCSESKQKSQETKSHTASPVATSDPVLQLERVPTTTQAVYQTLTTTENVNDSIKTEVDEVHNLLTNQKTLLGADGKAIVSHSFMYGPDSTLPINELSSSALIGLQDNYSNLNALAIVCEICKMPFQTEKTLKIHIQKKHTSSTYVFQCPTCSLTFLQPAAVIRHLANEHKKPLRRIRKMRDSILKKRIQIGDVQVKGQSREVKRLKLNETKDVEDNILQQQNGKPISTCTHCKKNFERRAALATHLTNCPARKLPGSTNNADLSSKTKIENEEKHKPNKTHNTNANQHLEKRQNQKTNEIKKLEQNKTIVNIKQEPLEEISSTNTTTNTPSSSSSSTINEMFENLEKQTFGNGLQTVSLDKLDLMVDRKMEEEDVNAEVIKQEENEKSADHDKEATAKVTAINGEKKKTKRFRIVPASKQLACRCKICNKQFNALSNLRRHISMFHYRSRRFGCNLCDYRAFRRYDIVNHLTFVHKMTGEREAMAVEHVTVHDIKYSRDDVEGDIVVVNDQLQTNDEGATKVEQVSLKLQQQELQQLPQVATLKTYEKRGKRKKVLLPASSEEQEPTNNEDATTDLEISHIKVVRKRLKKSLANQLEGQQNRPIRNRIKTVNKDFVYDLLTLKDETKEPARLGPKRRNTLFVDHNIELSPPPIKITPYRLRTEPLIAVSNETIKGFATSVYRNAILEGLAAPSTLPELPAERPQMRSRLISSSRNDSNPVPVIETTELEAARLKSTLFDDSFLEKFAKKSNPSFRMKPLLALQHSPLNSILQKFDTTLQNTSKQSTQTGIVETIKTNEYDFVKPLEQLNNSPPNYTVCTLSSLTEQTLQEMEITPNGKHILEPSSPPSTPKKRITLMQRLAENRAKRRDSLLRNALEN